jgi:hypothetical protein
MGTQPIDKLTPHLHPLAVGYTNGRVKIWTLPSNYGDDPHTAMPAITYMGQFIDDVRECTDKSNVCMQLFELIEGSLLLLSGLGSHIVVQVLEFSCEADGSFHFHYRHVCDVDDINLDIAPVLICNRLLLFVNVAGTLLALDPLEAPDPVFDEIPIPTNREPYCLLKNDEKSLITRLCPVPLVSQHVHRIGGAVLVMFENGMVQVVDHETKNHFKISVPQCNAKECLMISFSWNSQYLFGLCRDKVFCWKHELYEFIAWTEAWFSNSKAKEQLNNLFEDRLKLNAGTDSETRIILFHQQQYVESLLHEIEKTLSLLANKTYCEIFGNAKVHPGSCC